MPLTPPEARENFNRLRADLDKIEAALEPDPDGKVRVTGAEARDILRTLPVDAVKLLVDLVD
jgi:hypothetical protein